MKQKKIRKELEKYYKSIGKLGEFTKYSEDHKDMMNLFYPLLKILEELAFGEEVLSKLLNEKGRKE